MLKAFSRWYFVSKISFHDSAMTDCEFTRARLEKLGVTCAPINRELIETYVSVGIRQGYFPRPATAVARDLIHAAANVEAPVI
jgi:hypothetical protein